MAKAHRDIAASVRQRLLNLARKTGRVFDVVLVNYGLERLIHRLSLSPHRDRFILKGGMLVTLWTDDDHRVTRDADFLGYGALEEERLITDFKEILGIKTDDGLRYDVGVLSAVQIREEHEYGGFRLKTFAYLGTTRIPITIDVGFGDAVADPSYTIDYPSLLDMPSSNVRAYPPATVIAEKFHAITTLGLANGRMKDFYDLWAIPSATPVEPTDLDAAIRATFERRATVIPTDRPVGLSQVFVDDERKSQQWTAYINSIGLEGLALGEVVESIWSYLGPACARISLT